VVDQERVQEYQQTLTQLEQDRESWENLWEEITQYYLPSRDMWSSDENTATQDVKKGRVIYDSKPVAMLQTLANGMVGYNAGPSSPWFRLRMASEELNELPFVKDWLEDSEKRLYTIFSMTNFYDALTEFYLDLGSIGTATQIVEESVPHGIVYSTRHPKETFILEGQDGRVDSTFRQVWYTGRQALQRYGMELEERTRDLFQTPDGMNTKYEFLHVIQPRYDRNVYSDLNSEMPFTSIEMYTPDDSVLIDSGFFEMPSITGRWRKNSYEVYGRSPGMDALPDTKRSNQTKKSLMDAAQLAVQRPMNVPREMMRKINMMPGGLNEYKDPNRRIFPVDSQTVYPFGVDILNRFHDDIGEHFFIDLFKMLSNAQREMTAREVAERQGERVIGLSGPLTRQNSEVLRPLVKRTFNIAFRNGWLRPPPAALLQTGIPIDVDFIGLLAMAQKQYYRANGLNRAVAFTAGVAEASGRPEVWDNVNLDDLVRRALDGEGLPQTSIEEEPIVAQKRAARAAAIQQQQQMENAERVAGMVPNLQKAPEPGSPAEAVTRQLTGGQG
jgi:hypothetical protein